MLFWSEGLEKDFTSLIENAAEDQDTVSSCISDLTNQLKQHGVISDTISQILIKVSYGLLSDMKPMIKCVQEIYTSALTLIFKAPWEKLTFTNGAGFDFEYDFIHMRNHKTGMEWNPNVILLNYGTSELQWTLILDLSDVILKNQILKFIFKHLTAILYSFIFKFLILTDRYEF